MDATERELFAASLRHATGGASGPALDAALDELGWADALVADPQAAVSLLFEQQGAANATSSALDHVLLDALGLVIPTAFVLPALGRCDPPGTLAGETLVVRGLATAALGRREVAVVVASTEAGLPAAVTVETTNLTLRTVHGFDPALALVEVAGEGVPAVPAPTSAVAVAARPAVAQASASGTTRAPAAAGMAHPGASVLGDRAWPKAVAAGQRAVGHELVGAARAMLRVAREHALDRVQFGRPIGSFQAVRHRLADTLVAIEAADAALQAAWDDPSPVNAALAKALAGRSALTAARHCQQVLAGIGFTVEHPLHRHVRRVRVLDQLLGNARTLTRQLGEDLLATHRLPALLPL